MDLSCPTDNYSSTENNTVATNGDIPGQICDNSENTRKPEIVHDLAITDNPEVVVLNKLDDESAHIIQSDKSLECLESDPGQTCSHETHLLSEQTNAQPKDEVKEHLEISESVSDQVPNASKNETERSESDLWLSSEHVYKSYDRSSIPLLSTAFLEKCGISDLEKFREDIIELRQNQLSLLESLQAENLKFEECPEFQQLDKLMSTTKLYQGKLVSIRKEMLNVHSRVAKLKKRAIKLQQQQQKEKLLKEQKREAELSREKALIAKPVKKSTKENPPDDKA